MKEAPTPEQFALLVDEIHALSRTFLRRWGWGRRLEFDIIDDVQSEAAVNLLEEMQRLELPFSPRTNRDPALFEAMKRAASKAVNRHRDLNGGRRWEDTTTPFDPRSTQNQAETFTKHTIPLELKLKSFAHYDEPFAEEVDDTLSVDFGDEELNVLAQGLADGLSYTVIASRLGYDGPHARQFVYRRVQKLRESATLVELLEERKVNA